MAEFYEGFGGTHPQEPTKRKSKEMNKSLTIGEAITALNNGKCVSHRFFTDEEFIYKEKGILYDEKCGELDEWLFWDIRTDAGWQTDWKIVRE